MADHEQLQLQLHLAAPAPDVQPQVNGTPISFEQDSDIDRLVDQGVGNYSEAITKVVGQQVEFDDGCGDGRPVRSFESKQDGTPDRRKMSHQERRIADEPPAHIRAQMGRR